MTPPPPAPPTVRPRPALLGTLVVAVLAMAAAWPGLRNGFALDDVAIIADNPTVHALHQWWRIFALPYWPPRFGTSLYRPVTIFAFAVQWAAGGGAPWVFHAVSIAMYAGVSALVFRLFLLLLPIEAALAGAALFAAHPVHVEAVGNVVGQAELMAAGATVAALILYLKDRLADRLRPRTIAAIAVLFGLACLTKEHAVFLPALLFAAEVTVIRAPHRVSTIAPLYVTLVAVGLLHLTARTMTLHSFLGEEPAVPVHGLARIGVALTIAPHWVRLLAWPVHLSADYSPRALPIPSPSWFDVAAGAMVVLAVVAAFFALGARGWLADGTGAGHAARAGLALTVVALVPVSNLLTVLLLGERTLFVPSIGAMLMVGAAFALAWRGAVPVRSLSLAAVVALVALGCVRSRARQPVWRDDATLFAQTVRDAPESYRAHFLYGQLLFDQGRRAEGERELRRAIALNPVVPDVSPLNYLATQYRMAGMCPQALPLYERALRDNAERADVRYGTSACLLALGQSAAARRLAQEGVTRGQLSSLFRGLIASVDSVERTRQ